jgi:Tol biopolymer transport system component
LIDRGGRRTRLSEGWGAVGTIAWSPDGGEIWFSATKSGLSRSLHAVGLDGRERPLAQFGANADVHDVSRDGRVLLALGRIAREVRGRLEGDAEERDYSWLDGTMAPFFSSDRRSFIFNEAADGGGARVGAYLRRADGSAPLRLGDGTPVSLSPDGKWAVCINVDFPRQLRLVPTGAGESRTLRRGRISDLQWAHYRPDGRGLVVVGSEQDRPTRLWRQDLPDGEPVPFTPEGTNTLYNAFTPDGRFVAATTSGAGGTWSLYPPDGGEPRPMRGIEPGDTPRRFTADGRSLFVLAPGKRPGRIVRLDLATGKRTPWLDLVPPDPAGVEGISVVDVTEDGRSYLYSYTRVLSDLYVVTGLR